MFIKFFKKLNYIFIFLIVFLAATELILRFLGAYFLLEQNESNIKDLLAADNKIRILCLGESTTASAYFATNIDYSWPKILEKKLNDSVSGFKHKFIVFNQGVPATTSHQINLKLEENLQRYRPHIVIGMLGVNDNPSYEVQTVESGLDIKKIYRSTKLSKLFDYLTAIFFVNQTAPPMIPNYENEFQKLHDYIANTKLINASEILNIQNDFFASIPQNHIGELVLRTSLSLLDLQFNPHKKNKLNLQNIDEIKNACFEYSLTFVKKNVIDSKVIDALMYCAESDRKLVANAVETILSTSFSNFTDSNINSLLNTKWLINEDLYEQLSRRMGLKLKVIEKKYSTQENMKSIYQKLNKKNIIYFSMTYPSGPINFLYRIFSDTSLPQIRYVEQMYVNRPAAKPELENLYFISNENFEKLCSLQLGDCYTDLWTAQWGGRFGHTTKKGYDLIAENVLKAFIENKNVIDKLNPTQDNK